MKKTAPARTEISLLQKITLIIFGVFFFVIILEIGLRMGGHLVLSLQEHRNLVSIRQKGTYRIMCLGESTTAGEYPVFLGEILNKRNIGVRFSVIDKGVIGINTTTILAQLEDNLDKYKPDAVVAMMGINDQGRHVPYDRVCGSRAVDLLRASKVYKLTRLLWLHIVTKLKETGFLPSVDEEDIRGLVPVSLKAGLKEYPVKEANSSDINSSDSKYLVNLGRLRVGQEEFSQAEELFKQAIKLNPRNDWAITELGDVYRSQNKLAQAEELFKQAIKLNPRNDWAITELGGIYRSQDNFPQAEELFKQAIKQSPRNHWAMTELGWIYRIQGKLPQAEELFKQAIRINPRNDWALMELGWLYKSQSKFPQAEEVLRQAVRIKPKDSRIYGALEVLYEEMDKPELAQECREKIKELRLQYCNPDTENNFLKFKEVLDKRRIRFVCVQYPACSIGPLKRIFSDKGGVIFVDNEGIFKEAIKKESYGEYFRDMFGGNFGHCTEKGNRLLAGNIAKVMLKEVFGK
ncbi:MAG: tetratricopeptide repeat protein [Candidatus Omnitrophota bacterium]